MWIEHRDTLAVFNILADEIKQQRALAGAACTNAMYVAHPLFGSQSDRNGLAHIGVFAEQNPVWISGNGRRGFCFAAVALQSRGVYIARRQMNKTDLLIAI